MSIIRYFTKNWLPPAIIQMLQHFRSGGVRFEGVYSSWEEASAECSGYNAENILAKVLAATLKVKRGDSVFERDSVLFDEIEYDWPVIAGLMWVAAANGGKLNVLDFGGALGSSYFQNRHFLQSLLDLKWNVVEQDHYVVAGRQYIQDEQLRFYRTIEECIVDNRPNVILLSSVTQYLPNPSSVLVELLRVNAEMIVLDKTIVNHGDHDKLFVQHVSGSIYSASYPCWSFSESGLAEKMGGQYKLLTSFPSINFPALSSVASEFKGFIFTQNITNEVNR
jgi:putative methyltransferase (TIGR04325 family)